MTKARIHLMKTLCAVRWIALLNGNTAAALAVEKDMRGLA